MRRKEDRGMDKQNFEIEQIFDLLLKLKKLTFDLKNSRLIQPLQEA